MVLTASLTRSLHRNYECNTRDDLSIVYLNNAAQARLDDSVRQAGADAISREPWESQHEIAVQAQDQIRQLFATIIDTEPSNIAIHPSTAFAVTTAAENIWRLFQAQRQRHDSTTGDKHKILIMEDEFNSAVYPWQDIVERSNGSLQLDIVPYPNDDDGDDDSKSSWTDAIFERLDDSVLVACLTPLHWSNGAIVDLSQISHHCKRLDVMLVIDSTQASGIYPCSVAQLQPDVLCCSVHKWLRGPSGTSLVYIHPKWHDAWQPLDQHARGRPLDVTWDAYPHTMDAATGGYPTEYYNDARKFDAGGKPDPIRLPMLAAALRHVATVHVDQAQAQLAVVMQPMVDWCAAQRRLYSLPSHHCNHLIGIRPSHLSVEQMLQVATVMAQQDGIYIAVKCGSFRISPYLDTTVADMQRLVQALQRHCEAIMVEHERWKDASLTV